MRFSLFLAVAVVAVVFCISEVNGQEKTCKSILQDLTKRQMSGITKCTKSMKFKNGKDKSAKSNCILKCVMVTEGILTPDGLWSMENLDVFLAKEKFPEEMIPRMKTMFMPCFEDFGPLFDVKEEFCKTYDPFIKCAMTKLPLLCAEG